MVVGGVLVAGVELVAEALEEEQRAEKRRHRKRDAGLRSTGKTMVRDEPGRCRVSAATATCGQTDED